ncbi:MAG: Nre family DNA repair protein [Candidatus Bathyarchaeia archaeon]
MGKVTVFSRSKFGLDLANLIAEPKLIAELNPSEVDISYKVPNGSLCVLCKGARMLCGKSRCPIIVRLYHYVKTLVKIKGLNLDGSSPPSVFVGRFGYPYVFVGPLTPPVHGDTSIMDTPELWFGKSIDEIAEIRLSLIRGNFKVRVDQPIGSNRLLDEVRDLAISNLPVEVEMFFRRKPSGVFLVDDEVQPFGASAPVESLKIGSLKIDYRIEKAYNDYDLKASDAVLELYKNSVPVSKIQRAFSVGVFGEYKRRRLVPTRWSITAVDSIISNTLMENVRENPIINEYRVYESDYLDNRFEILMIPDAWSYESIEAWYPGTVWNPRGDRVVMFGDYEGFYGRTTYADMGGCYYAARLAVTERLVAERRQASILVLREAHPGYIMPVGVWQVRENVRNALRRPPLKFNKLEDALEYLFSKLSIPRDVWIRKSTLLKQVLHQRKLTFF